MPQLGARSRMTTLAGATVADVLLRHAGKMPDKVAFRFLASGDLETSSLTFGELTQRAQSFAVYLREREPPGTRVLLLLESGLSFIEAFFACMFAGLVPIPVDLPRVKRPVNRLDF